MLEVKQRYIEALTTVNLAKAEIERLIAFPTVGREGRTDEREEPGR